MRTRLLERERGEREREENGKAGEVGCALHRMQLPIG